ncbi:hypothetical protein [Phreatobacter sp. AB_2022a]|uniref:hypothetical protein n=1 Tax=Phreatobacter sp. AB_2022a TaxID=3003134 RepID=UPI0022870D0D|nr:hypothetical protein [Phreatobacter sp. AB_2022a]MCZ0733214.1 hypothetical protein [Phreatobacter sp. AB_2022a]
MRFRFLLVAALILTGLAAQPAKADTQGVVIGVNRVNLNGLPPAERERIIREMVANGVKVARLNIVRPTPEGIQTLRIAQANGLAVILNIGVLAPEYMRADAPQRPAIRRFSARPRLSQLDPARFEQRFAALWHEIERTGVSLVAVEFSNELNWADFNGDLNVGERGTVYDAASLARMPGLSDFERGLDNYVGVLKVARRLRDASQTFARVPILSAGIADIPPDWAGRSGGDAVDGAVFLAALKQRGLFDLVDGIGLHLYPEGRQWQAHLRRQMTLCGTGGPAHAPCWITEWGVKNMDTTCPSNDQARAEQVRQIEAEFLAQARAGRVKALIYYDWDSDRRFSIWRCNQLTPSGRIVLD